MATPSRVLLIITMILFLEEFLKLIIPLIVAIIHLEDYLIQDYKAIRISTKLILFLQISQITSLIITGNHLHHHKTPLEKLVAIKDISKATLLNQDILINSSNSVKYYSNIILMGEAL